MALIILAHPYFNVSVANKTIIQELQNYDSSLEIRDIYSLYPNGQIDSYAEQEALIRHDLIIFQCPMFWLNMPDILHVWFDKVFSDQFVYGEQGEILKSKKLLFSFTIGQIENNFSIDSFLFFIQKLTKYAKMDYINPVYLYGVSSAKGSCKEDIQDKAKKHSQKLIKIISSL